MLRISRALSKGGYPRFQQRHPAIMLDMTKNNQRAQFYYQVKDLGEWSQKNERLYSPVKLNAYGVQENLRPAEVYHGRVRIRMSPKNMAHAAWFVRNMNVDEAIAKCRLTKRKSTLILADILMEAKELAKKQDVEFPSDMHLASSWSEYDTCERHQMMQGNHQNVYRTRYCNYYVMLREGPPPQPDESERTTVAVGNEHIKLMREREIIYGL